MGLTDDDVREILRIVDQSGVDELQLDVEGLSLHVRRGNDHRDAPPTFAAHDRAPAPAAPESPAPGSAADSGSEAGLAAHTVDAPMLGTFYRAEGPGHPPLIEVGDRVEPGTVLCLIEVMKLMNHIQAETSGTVAEVLVENGALVEFGQPLFRLAAET